MRPKLIAAGANQPSYVMLQPQADAMRKGRVSRHIRERLHRSIVVTLVDGGVLTGILWDDDGNGIVMRDTQIHEGPAPIPMDGEVLLQWPKIRYIQVDPREATE